MHKAFTNFSAEILGLPAFPEIDRLDKAFPELAYFLTQE
jgi:hypothetical protein